MSLSESAALGMAMRFHVVIDGYDLGSWTACKGLAVTFRHEKVHELGEHTMVKYIPGWVEYPTISLQRAMAKDDWDKTKEWLQFVASATWLLTPDIGGTTDLGFDIAGAAGADAGGGSGAAGALLGPSSGKITLHDSQLAEVASWELQNLLPSAWKGPTFDANGKAIAIETLELVHEGFLVCANV